MSLRLLESICKNKGLTVDIKRNDDDQETVVAIFRNGNIGDYIELILPDSGTIEWNHWLYNKTEYELIENKTLDTAQDIEEELENFVY